MRRRDDPEPEPEPTGLAAAGPWLVVGVDLFIGVVSVRLASDASTQQMTGFSAVLATAMVLALAFRGKPIVRPARGFDRLALWALVCGLAAMLCTVLMLPFVARVNVLAPLAVALGIAGVFAAFRSALRVHLDGGTVGSFAAARAGAMLCSLAMVLAIRAAMAFAQMQGFLHGLR